CGPAGAVPSRYRARTRGGAAGSADADAGLSRTLGVTGRGRAAARAGAGGGLLRARAAASCGRGPLADEEREQEPDDRGAGEQRVDAVEDAAVAREQGAHVLDGQVALDHGFGQVAENGGGERRDARDDALPPVTVEQCREQYRARHNAKESRAREAFPGFLRGDDGGHLVPAGKRGERDAREIAADIAADRENDEDQDALAAVGRRQHRGDRRAEERQVRGGEQARGDVL